MSDSAAAPDAAAYDLETGDATIAVANHAAGRWAERRMDVGDEVEADHLPPETLSEATLECAVAFENSISVGCATHAVARLHPPTGMVFIAADDEDTVDYVVVTCYYYSDQHSAQISLGGVLRCLECGWHYRPSSTDCPNPDCDAMDLDAQRAATYYQQEC